jgi:hypothetical protein
MAETARATGVEGRIVNVSSTIHSWFSGDDAVAYLDRVTRRKMYVVCRLHRPFAVPVTTEIEIITDRP